MFAIKGKNALVTGVGRRGGIGFSICSLLAQEGANVFFTYWHAYDAMLQLPGAGDDPSLMCGDLRKFGTDIECAEFDLSLPNAAELLYAKAEEEIGTPDILVNNACYSSGSSLKDITAEELDLHFAVNVRATVLLCKLFSDSRASDGRVIVNMTSGQAISAMSGELAYAVTKEAADMLAKQIAPELALQGIRIISVDPGPTDTGWMPNELKAAIKRESSTHLIHTPENAASFIIRCIVNDGTASGGVIHAPR